MPFVKLVKNNAYFSRFQVKYRRRREGKTDCTFQVLPVPSLAHCFNRLRPQAPRHAGQEQVVRALTVTYAL